MPVELGKLQPDDFPALGQREDEAVAEMRRVRVEIFENFRRDRINRRSRLGVNRRALFRRRRDRERLRARLPVRRSEFELDDAQRRIELHLRNVLRRRDVRDERVAEPTPRGGQRGIVRARSAHRAQIPQLFDQLGDDFGLDLRRRRHARAGSDGHLPRIVDGIGGGGGFFGKNLRPRFGDGAHVRIRGDGGSGSVLRGFARLPASDVHAVNHERVVPVVNRDADELRGIEAQKIRVAHFPRRVAPGFDGSRGNGEDGGIVFELREARLAGGVARVGVPDEQRAAAVRRVEREAHPRRFQPVGVGIPRVPGNDADVAERSELAESLFHEPGIGGGGDGRLEAPLRRIGRFLVPAGTHQPRALLAPAGKSRAHRDGADFVRPHGKDFAAAQVVRRLRDRVEQRPRRGNDDFPVGRKHVDAASVRRRFPEPQLVRSRRIRHADLRRSFFQPVARERAARVGGLLHGETDAAVEKAQFVEQAADGERVGAPREGLRHEPVAPAPLQRIRRRAVRAGNGDFGNVRRKERLRGNFRLGVPAGVAPNEAERDDVGDEEQKGELEAHFL